MRSPPANQDSADGVWPPSATLLATVSKRSCISGLLSWSRLPADRWAQQQIECDDVRDHQQGYVDDRDRIGAAQLPRRRRKAGLNGVVIVDDDVGWAHNIEGDDAR